MLRGTRVGQAYVAITADGSGINKEIADAFDEVDYDDIGDEHGKAYSDRIRAHLRALDKDFSDMTDKIGNRLSSKLSKAIETDSALSQGVSRTLAKAFDSGKLDDLIQHVGRKAGVTFGGEFDKTVTGEVLSALENAMQKAARSGNLDLSRLVHGADSGGGQIELFGPVLDEAVRSVQAAQKKMEQAVEKSVKERVAAEKAGQVENSKIAKRFAEARIKLVAQVLEKEERLHEMSAKAEAALLKDQQRLYDRLRTEKLNKDIAADKALWDVRNKTLKAWIKLDADRARGSVDEKGSGVSRNGNDGGIGDSIGRMLGKGSRNNALNLLGGTIGGIIGMLAKGGKFATSMFTTFTDGASRAGDAANIFQKGLGGISAVGTRASTGLMSLAAAAPMVVAAGAVIMVAMSALVSVLGALLAIVVALVSTIASALVGALIVGAGAFAAIGIAAGLATLAFTSMTDKQRKAAAATFEPIHAMAAALGQIMMKDIIPAFATWSRNLQEALVLVKPLAEVMGGAFAKAGSILTNALSGPGFQKLISTLKTELPTIVTSLSGAFGSFLNGIAGMLAAILPKVTQFSGYLEDTAAAFSKWVNSPKGQNAIVDFVDRAVASLKSLWGFVKEVGGFITDLLFNPEAQNAGNSIFGSITAEVKEWRDAIKRATENGDLKRWFDDAKKFGAKLWHVLEDLGGTFKALYDDGALDAVGVLLDGMSSTLKILNTFLDPMVRWAGTTLPAALTVALAPVNALSDAVGYLSDKIQDAIDKFKNLPSLGSIGGDLGGSPGTREPTPQGTSSFMDGAQGGSGTTGSNTGIPSAVERVAKGANEMLDRIDRNWKNRGDDIDDLIKAGTKTLNNTSESAGGHKPESSKSGGGKSGGGKSGGDGKSGGKGKKPQLDLEPQTEWENPYIEMANRIMVRAASLADDIRASAQEARRSLAAAMADASNSLTELLRETGDTVTAALRDAVSSSDAAGVASSFASMIEGFATSAAAASAAATATAQQGIDDAKSARDQMVASAEAAVQSAASRLAGASNPAEVKAALKELTQAKYNLSLAKATGAQLIQDATEAADGMIAAAQATQAKVDAASAIISAQGVLNLDNVQGLLNSVANTNATLADYAEARRIVTERLVDANQKLADAIALRDNYGASVSDAVKSFGSLISAQAKTVNGISQALTAGDITDNLRDRLTKVKKFQENLRLLLAQGLSQDAYKQLVDAGVEGGSAYAQALVDGGQGSISEVNNLTDAISTAADGLGDAAASQLYQAGVDAAQGLVDGLLSLSGQLDTAAAALGQSIADAIKRALGIASPSRVLRGMMTYVGDGTVLGLDDQHAKVGAAGARLAAQVAVSPEVAAYAAQQRSASTTTPSDGVSGNDGPKFLWTGDIVTPTKDPTAVALEVLNEVTGRLP